MSGESLHFFHIIYEVSILFLIVVIILVLYLPCFIFWNALFPHQEVNLSTETALTEQQYSFVWSQFSHIQNSLVEPWTITVILNILAVIIYSYFLLQLCMLCRDIKYHYGFAFRKPIYVFFVLILILYVLDEL